MSVQIEEQRYRIEEHLPTVRQNIRGRYWIIGLGGYGTKLGARVCRQLDFSRVDEVAVATFLDMDSQQMGNLVRILTQTDRVPIVYPVGLGDQDFHDEGEGKVRATIEQSWATRSSWIPITDRLLDTSVRRLQIDLISPAATIIAFSCGGHLLTTAHVAHRAAIEFPKAKRVGVTAIPGDAKSAAEFLKFLEIISSRNGNSEFPWQTDERAEPLFHHLLLTDNGLDPRTHDRLVPLFMAALASKVRGERSGSESLLNVLELMRLNKVPPKETSYLTLEYVVDPIPVKKPRKPCWFGRTFLRRPVLPPYTDTPVLVARSDAAISALVTGHGVPAFHVPTEDAAMIMSVPSSDTSWRQIHQVETDVTERMKHRETGVIGEIHGPYWGRYPVESSAGANEAEPLAGILLQRIHGGRETVKHAVLANHPDIHALLPSATIPLGLLKPVDEPTRIRDLAEEEKLA